jgi:dienelactone hydrolase
MRAEEGTSFQGWNPRALMIPAACLLLTACGGGGSNGGSTPVGGGQTNLPSCDATSVIDGDGCRTFGEREVVRASTPFVEDGQPVTLEVVLYRPLTEGPFPTLVFHHGSTGNGSDPSLFGITFTDKTIASYFVDRGWMVAFPQRRGRGASDGLYDEGFTANRSGYSCEASRALAGAEHALDDADAIIDWLRLRTDVDVTRMLTGGASRGGILSIAHVERRPDIFLGVVNFVGGWIAQGCGDHLTINRALFEAGAPWSVPSVWIYGQNDSFYSVNYSRGNFDAYTVAGGMGSFHAINRGAGLNGHFLLGDDDLWGDAVAAFLSDL